MIYKYRIYTYLMFTSFDYTWDQRLDFLFDFQFLKEVKLYEFLNYIHLSEEYKIIRETIHQTYFFIIRFILQLHL